MGNKRNRRSRRSETSSPDRRLSETQEETPDPGKKTFTNTIVNVQKRLGCSNPVNQLTELIQISNEIISSLDPKMEEKNTDRITKMR